MKKIVTLLLAVIMINVPVLCGQEAAYVPGDILAKVSGSSAAERISADLSFISGKPTGLKAVKLVSRNTGIWLFHFDESSVSHPEMLRHFRNHPNVLEAQNNHYIQQREKTPNDPSYNQQWQWQNNGTNGGTADADVDAELAWDITTGGVTALGDTIVVCVVDDGTNFSHADLAPTLWKNKGEIPSDGIDNDGNGYVDDYFGWNILSQDDLVGEGLHGCSVSGMIGAAGNNSTGVTGINWNVKIMNVRYGQLIESSVIESYDYPLTMRKLYNATNGAKGAYVVATNSSWGIDQANAGDFPLWCSFYDTLGVHGILSCASTTNNFANVDIVGDMPTTCSSNYLISVGSTNSSDQVEGGTGVVHVDIGAPGINIYTTSKSGYKSTSGTSFASPLVAGIIALMYSAPCTDIVTLSKSNPGQAALLMKQYLLEGVDKKASLEGKYLTGGRANAYNSIIAMLNQCGACLPPFNLTATPISDTEAEITWTLPDSVTEVQLQYRKTGETWISKYHIQDTTIPIFNLEPCTEYEIQLASYCNDSLSTYTQVVSFKTLGCCEGPSGITSTVTDTSAQVQWQPLFGIESYTLHIKKESETDFNKLETKGNSIDLSDLEKCTVYQLFISAECKDGNLTASDTVSLKTSGCGACESTQYCDAFGSEFEEEWISNVTIDGQSNDSQNDGYKFFSNISFTLDKQKSSQISLTPAYAGINFDEYFRVWIDYNQDGDFDDSTELVFDPIETNTTVSGTFQPPASALPGYTRMRIAMSFAGFGGDKPTACGELIFGEVEDYCVFIKDSIIVQPICTAPVNLEIVELSKTNVKLNWSTVPLAINYTLEYKEISESIWTEVPAVAAPPIAIGGLLPDHTYEWRIKTNCGTEFSEYSVTDTFTTLKPDATTFINADKVLSVYPNPAGNHLQLIFNVAGVQNVSASIRTVNGTELWREEHNLSENMILNIDLSRLSSGMYLMTVQTEKGMFVRKFIKH